MAENTTERTGISGNKQQTMLVRWFNDVVYFFRFRKRWRDNLWNTVVCAECPLCYSNRLRSTCSYGSFGEEDSVCRHEAICMDCGKKIIIDIESQRLIENKS